VIGLPSLRDLDHSPHGSAPLRIWLCVSPIDMRLGFDRLAELASAVTGEDALSGRGGEACTHLFAFRLRGGDRLKLLYWDREGLALWYKRLEEGTFKLPKIEGDIKSVELRGSELAMMLDGIDLRSIKRVRRYRKA